MVNPDLMIRKLLKKVLVLLTVMLSSNRLTAYNVKRGREEVGGSLLVFNLLKTNQPSLG